MAAVKCRFMAFLLKCCHVIHELDSNAYEEEILRRANHLYPVPIFKFYSRGSLSVIIASFDDSHFKTTSSLFRELEKRLKLRFNLDKIYLDKRMISCPIMSRLNITPLQISSINSPTCCCKEELFKSKWALHAWSAALKKICWSLNVSKGNLEMLGLKCVGLFVSPCLLGGFSLL